MPAATPPTKANQDLYPLVRLCSVLGLMTIGGGAMYASIMVLEPAVQEFQTGRGTGSLLYGAFMIGFALGGVVMGRLADRVGIMLPAIIGSLALPAGLYLAAYANSISQLVLALGVLCGFLGASFTFAPLISDISHWFTQRRGLAVGVAFSGSYVAGAIWPPVLQHLFDAQGWRETFMDLSLVTLGAMLLLSALLYPKPGLTDDGMGQDSVVTPSHSLRMTPAVLQGFICAAGFGCCVAMAMPQIHIVPYVMDLGHPAARGAEMLALMLGFGVVSRIISGWLSDRIGGVRTLIIGSILQLSVLLAFLMGNGLVFLYGLAIAFGLSQGGIVPSYTIIVRTFFKPDEAGWRISISFLFTILGMAFGGWIAGALYDLTGSYTMSFINAIGFNIVNLLIAAVLLKRATATASRQANHYST